MRTTLLAFVLAGCAGGSSPAPASMTVPAASADAGTYTPPPPAPLAAGGPCFAEGKEKCLSPTAALACHGGTWEAMKCGSPEGCAVVAGEEQCAQSGVSAKEVCNLASDFTCSADGAALMTCTSNRWTLAEGCLGDRKCSIEGKKVTCDNSLAKLDDACREEEDYACAIPDMKSALVCRSGRFVIASPCKGPKACRITGEKATGFKVECDDSIAVEGDPCDKEGHYACAADGTRILSCKSKRFAADDKCKKPEKCAIKGGMVGCYR